MARLPKLRALDSDDLQVLAACLQDAVVSARDMVYLPDEQRFVLVVNRFLWEDAPATGAEGQIYERVHAGVCFEGVTAVRRKGLRLDLAGQVLSLLTIQSDGKTVDIEFSAGAAIRLEVERLDCHMQDIDEPWPTQWLPAHPDETSGDAAAKDKR